jgi:hypothetical protein
MRAGGWANSGVNKQSQATDIVQLCAYFAVLVHNAQML